MERDLGISGMTLLFNKVMFPISNVRSALCVTRSVVEIS